jgi:outer membrane receptor protein involved in Fe transport
MLRLLAFILLTVSLPLSARAQATSESSPDRSAPRTIGEINGMILGADTDEPLPTATVAVWSLPDSSLVTGTAAGLDGRFAIARLPSGRYYLQVSFVGYAPFSSEPFLISPDSPSVDLSEIRLKTDSAQLEGIEVVAEREAVAFEIDRTVYNTRDNLAAAGGNATDLLQNIPSVEVDVDGNVSLRGNQNVGILINGKPAPARGDFLTTFLQQISADMIERVEVIPNPSAKFDPEGMAGMINIVLKKDAELGTSGGVTVGGATSGDYNVSGNLNFQRGKLTVFSNYGFRNDDRNSSGFNFRENRFLDPLTFLQQDSEGDRNGMSNLGSVSADYALTERSTLSASALLSNSVNSEESINLYEELGSLRSLNDRYDRLSQGDGNRTNVDLSTSFRRIVEASSDELTAEFRFNRSMNSDDDLFRERQLGLLDPASLGVRSEEINRLDRTESEWTAQVDYIRPIRGLRLETGYKAEGELMDNAFNAELLDPLNGVFVADLNRNNAFLFDQVIQAGYGILSGKAGSFEAQAGVRVERVNTSFDLDTTGETFDNAYSSLFPSAFLAYRPSMTSQVKVSYSKRVNRPRTSMLNPFTSYSDPQNLFVGNPYLLPEYTHALETSYQRFSRTGSLSITPYFRRTVDKMERYKTVEPNGTSTLTWRNFDRSDSYGAEIVGSLRLGSKLSGFASFNAYRVVTDGSNVDGDLSADALSWSSRANLSYKVRDGLDIQAFYFYRAPTDVAQGRISSFSVANFSVRQKLMNDKASLSLRVSDPLDRMGFRFEVDNNDFYQLGTRKWESRQASLTFTYNFGQAPKRNQQRRPDEGGMDMGGDMGIN